jgi:hypothetical protein
MQADILTNVITGAFGVGLFLLTLIYVFSLRGYIKPVSFSFILQLFIMAVNIAALAAYVLIMQITANSILAATAGFVGLFLGYLIFGSRKIFVYKAHVEIKRSIIPGILITIAYIGSAFFNVFGGANLMSLGMIIVILATGVGIGSMAADCINGVSLQDEAKRSKRINARLDTHPAQTGEPEQKTEQEEVQPKLQI